MAELFTAIPSTVRAPLIPSSPLPCALARRPSYKPTSNDSANSLSQSVQAGDLNIIQFAPLPRLEIAQSDRTDGNANEAQRRMAHGRSHAADLPVLPFAQGDLEPGRRDGLAEPDGDRTRREIRRRRKQLDLRRPRAPTAEEDPVPKAGRGPLVGNAFDLDQVDFRKLVAGVRDVVGQRTLPGGEEEAFPVVGHPPPPVENPGREVTRPPGAPPPGREAPEHP